MLTIGIRTVMIAQVMARMTMRVNLIILTMRLSKLSLFASQYKLYSSYSEPQLVTPPPRRSKRKATPPPTTPSPVKR